MYVTTTRDLLHIPHVTPGLPISFEWEQSNDDTTATAAERLIRTQLSPMSGQNGPPCWPTPSSAWTEVTGCCHCCATFSLPL
jgi:hypothetical protein